MHESHQRLETVINSGGADLWTASRGSGPPILLCNGGPGCCDYLKPVSAMLEERARVLRWEQRGCGRSTADGRYDLATTLDDIEAIRRHHGFARWIVGGHSWGADLALAYAWHYPERTAGLLAISGGLLLKDKSWSEAYHAGKAGRDEAQPPYAYEPNLEVNRALNASWREFTHRADLWRRASAITCPALWLYAENDIRPSWPEQQVAALLPRGEFRLIAGAEHVIWLTHASALRAELLRWWETQDWSSQMAPPLREPPLPLGNSPEPRVPSPTSVHPHSLVPGAVSVRPVIVSDAAAWQMLREQLWPDDPARHVADIAAFFAGGAREPAAVFVAELADGSLAGFAELSIRRDYVEGATSLPVAYLEGWFVAPAHRGQDIGKHLVACAETWAVAAGFTELASDAAADNVVSIRAHQACGFRPAATNLHFIKSIAANPS